VEAACTIRAGFAKDLLSGALVVYLAEGYRQKSMARAMTTPARLIAWLLCAVLACLAIHSPHCDLCDGPFAVALSSPQ
jgi:cytochrome c oxidase assembly factor CtaG